MKNRYEIFDQIHTDYYNGAIVQCKKAIKSLPRKDRYNLIMYSREGVNNKYMSDTIMKWIVRGELK